MNPDLSLVAGDLSAPSSPILVLDCKLKTIGSTVDPRILVQWDSVTSLQTWEDERTFIGGFLKHQLGEKLFLKGG